MILVSEEMANGTFRPKVQELLKKYEKTLYQTAKDGAINYSTVHRWMKTPDKIDRVEGRVLFGFLQGLGLTLEEVNELRLGDVFEFTPEDESEQIVDGC